MKHTHKALQPSKSSEKKTPKKRRSVRFILPGEEDTDSRQTCNRSSSISDIESHISYCRKPIDPSNYIVTLINPQLPIDSCRLNTEQQKLLKEGKANCAKKSTKGKGLNKSMYVHKESYPWSTLTVKTLQMESQQTKSNERIAEKPKGILKQTTQLSKDKNKERQTINKKSKEKNMVQPYKSKIQLLSIKEKAQRKEIALREPTIQKQQLSSSTFKGFKLSNDECLIYEFFSKGSKKQVEYKGKELKAMNQDARVQVLKSYLLKNAVPL